MEGGRGKGKEERKRKRSKTRRGKTDWTGQGRDGRARAKLGKPSQVKGKSNKKGGIRKGIQCEMPITAISYFSYDS